MRKNTNKKYRTKNELRSLCNVGPATQRDLELLGITTIEQLAQADPNVSINNARNFIGI
jgi:predicted flap endonuclease-1-like 5' DNA nuclease